jgi:UDP-glucose 4-epimerase
MIATAWKPWRCVCSTCTGRARIRPARIRACTTPTIFGDGEQSRDFTYVDDVAELCWKAAHAPGVAGKTFNAGNGGRFTLNYVWDLLQRTEGLKIAPKFGPPRAGDVRHSMADTSAAVRELGHAPRVSFEEGLRRTIEWYRQSK